MGVPVGSAFVPVLPDMTKFGAATATGIQKSTTGLGSKLKSSFGPLGVTLGAVFALGFAKSAFSEFEDAEKSLAGFDKALENTGQQAAINRDTFNSWLADFALGIGRDDDELRDLATTLVNAFDFSKFGPDAEAMLEQVTTSIVDMSAATGLAETRLKKMFLSILNDPAAAVTQLQKLNVVTEAQADEFKAMADAGDDAAVTTTLLELVSKKYAGTAAATTTESEKMSAAFGEFKETVGRLLATVLRPLVQIFTGLFRFLQDKPVVVLGLATAFTVLGIAMKRAAIATFATNVKAAILSVAGLGPKIFALATSIGTALVPALTGGAAAAAGFGVALVAVAVAVEAIYLGQVISDINKFNNEAEAADDRAAALSYTLSARTATSVSQLREEYRRLKDEFDVDNIDLVNASMEALNRQVQSGDLSWEQYDRAVSALASGLDSEVEPAVEAARLSVDEVAAATREAASSATRARSAYNKFAGLTKQAFSEWAASVSQSLRSTTTSVSGFSKEWAFTAKSFQQTVKQMAQRARQIARAFRALDTEAIPDAFRKWLVEQGPDAVRAFTRSSDEGQRDIVRSWRAIDKATDSTERRINNLDKTAGQLAAHQRGELARGVDVAGTAFDNASDRAEFYRSRLQALDGMTVTTTIRTETVGGGSNGGGGGGHRPLAEGGIVTRPGVFQVGEAGPEAVIPLGRGGMRVTGDLRVRDWRQGIVELDGELDWNERATG